jgi:MFS family permease
MSARSLGKDPWGVLAVAVVAQLGVSVVDQGVPTLTGFVKSDLGLSAFEAGLTVSSFAFGKILGAYAAGVAADRVGERAVLVAGGLATAALVLAAAFSPLPLFAALLVLAGIAGAASTPAGGRLVLLAFPPERHGIALGIRQTGIPLGGLVAAALLPWIAHFSSWHWSLAVASGITAAAVIPLALTGVRRIDVVPRTAARAPGRSTNRTIRLLTIWGCLLVTGQYAILAFLALDVHNGSRLTLAQASLLVAVANASGIVGRVAWGAVSDRMLTRGRKPLLLVVNIGGLIGALLLAVVSPAASPVLLAGVAALAGLTLIGYQGLWVTMIAEAAGPDRVGAATGFAITFVGAAIAISPPLYGLVADVTGTYRSIWIVLSGLLVIALVPALLIEEHAVASD